MLSEPHTRLHKPYPVLAPKQPPITEEYLRSCLVTKRTTVQSQPAYVGEGPWLSVCRPIWNFRHQWYPARGHTKEEAEQRAVELAMDSILKDWAARE